jgi:hypothetical protein
MFSVSEDSVRQSRCVFILRVSLTGSQCRNKRKPPAVAVLVAVCLDKDMIYARAYCFQKCVGNERERFKHRRGTEPGPTGLSILLSWRVFANYSAYFEIRCLILLVSYLSSLCARFCRHEDPGIARSSESPFCFARINPKAGLLSTGKH